MLARVTNAFKTCCIAGAPVEEDSTSFLDHPVLRQWCSYQVLSQSSIVLEKRLFFRVNLVSLRELKGNGYELDHCLPVAG